MPKTVVSTWMYSEPKGQESYYPQVGGITSSVAFQAIYWRCVVVFFASSIRCNPNHSHRLYTTSTDLPIIDGFDVGNFFRRHHIQVIHVPFTYLPPAGYHKAWRNQFYILDILKWLSENAAPDEQALIVDSDCIFIKPVSPLEASIAKHGLIGYDMQFADIEDINGLTRQDMNLLFESLGVTARPSPPIYFGGEFFAADKEAIDKLAKDIDLVWQWCLDRFKSGQLKFNEEAHFLSYLYYKNNYCDGSGNLFISRIWTGFAYRTANQSNFDLLIWHVPAEKKYGTKRLYGQVINPRSRFWTTNLNTEYLYFVGGYVGIPHSSVSKKLYDICDALRWRIGSTITKG